jgi:hypothetical protein
MKVYVVIHGEIYHGGYVVGIRETEERARELALMTETHFKGGWKEDLVDRNYWTNGDCDYVMVKEFEVLP